MTDFFVAKNGNDANPGTVGSPKRTIGGAISAAVSTDTIHVSAGVYHESSFVNKSLTITSDGHYVVLDGLGVLSNGIVLAGNLTAVTIRGIYIRNYVTNLISEALASSQRFFTLDKCFLDGTTFNPVGYLSGASISANISVVTWRDT